MAGKDQKSEVLSKLIDMRRTVDRHEEEISDTNRRVDALGGKVEEVRQEAQEDKRRLFAKIRRVSWEFRKIAFGQRKAVEEHSHRITDTKARLDRVQKIVNWTIATVLGLFITTVLAALLKLVFK